MTDDDRLTIYAALADALTVVTALRRAAPDDEVLRHVEAELRRAVETIERQLLARLRTVRC